MKNTFIMAMAVFLIAVVGCSKKSDSGSNASTGGDTASTSGSTSDSTNTAKAAVAIAPVVTPAVAPVIGEEVPEVTGPDTDGEMFNLSDYRGKVVMIDFWGDW